MTQEQIDNIFSYHKPFGDQAQRYERLRAHARELAVTINALAPESREKSLAFTALQQCIMWANAAIAINEREPAPHPPVNESDDDQRNGLGEKLAKAED